VGSEVFRRAPGKLKKLVEQDPGATLAELLERSKVEASIMAVFARWSAWIAVSKKVAPRCRTGSSGCQSQAR